MAFERQNGNSSRSNSPSFGSTIAPRMPSNTDAEISILACAIRDPKLWFALNMTSKDFYSFETALIAFAFENLILEQASVDPITIRHYLETNPKRKVRPEALSRLSEGTLNRVFYGQFDMERAPELAKIVQDLACLRRIQERIAKAQNHLALGGSPQEILAKISTDFATLGQSMSGTVATVEPTDAMPYSEYVLGGTYLERKKAIWRGDVAAGLTLGFPSLDRALGGALTPGKNVGILGIPGAGKSALFGVMAYHFGLNNRPFFMCQTEMSSGDFTDRIVAMLAHVEVQKLNNSQEFSQMTKEEMLRVENLWSTSSFVEAMKLIQGCYLTSKTFEEFQMRMAIEEERMKRKFCAYGLDYLTNLHKSNERDDDRQHAKNCMKKCKDFSGQHGYVGLIAAQPKQDDIRKLDDESGGYHDLKDTSWGESSEIQRALDFGIALNIKAEVVLPNGKEIKLIKMASLKKRGTSSFETQLVFRGDTMSFHESTQQDRETISMGIQELKNIREMERQAYGH